MLFKGIEKHIFRKLHVCSTQVKNTKENGKTLHSAVKRMSAYLSGIQKVFVVGKKNVLDKALDYTKGLWISRLSNLEKISETGIPKNYHQLQNFISDSPWDPLELMDKVCREVSISLPKKKLIGLHIDESGNRKKGKKSVGVAPQYCGNVGKIDNCQVAVFAAISHGYLSSIVDSRLYLPEAWTSDKRRLEEAKVPVEHRTFKTKQQIALEIIKHQIELGTAFDYIGGDAYYGADQKLTDAIDEMALPFVMDIRENQHVFLKKPEISIPERKSNRWKTPLKAKANIQDISVKEYQQTLSENDYKELKVRNTAKGKLKGLYHFKTVYLWDGESPHASKRLLVIRKTVKKKRVEIKYALGNVDLEQYTPEAIAYMQAQRFFIEHSFKEAKDVLGLDQFQTRKWIAWYHQVALNMVLLLFIMNEKINNFEQMPLLSAWDIKQIMTILLYSSDMNYHGLWKQIFERHIIRQKDINRYYSMN